MTFEPNLDYSRLVLECGCIYRTMKNGPFTEDGQTLEGPYTIIEKINVLVNRICKSLYNKTKVVRVDRLPRSKGTMVFFLMDIMFSGFFQRVL